MNMCQKQAFQIEGALRPKDTILSTKIHQVRNTIPSGLISAHSVVSVRFLCRQYNLAWITVILEFMLLMGRPVKQVQNACRNQGKKVT